MTMKKTVALFDCDGTLYAAQSGRGLLAYASQFGRKATVRRYYAATLPSYGLRKIKLISDESYLRPVISRLAWLVKGMSPDELRQASDWLTRNYLLPTEHPEITQRLREHQAQGHLVLLVSAQLTPAMDGIREHYGADGLIGTSLEMKDGRCSGRIIPPVITGGDKDRHTRGYFSAHGIEADWEASYAYADSITDTGLLGMVGHPVAAHPDPQLLALAQKSGWEVIGTSRAGL
jgi:putative phosphoserine phosphatase/1-acylglycerol-3-phosphate O-acyltransferase